LEGEFSRARAEGNVQHVIVKDRLKALRKRLALTQEAMAERGGLGRVEVVRVEGGHNDATSYRLRAGLARAAELGVEDLSAYLDGEIELEDAMARRRSGGAAKLGPETVRQQAAELAREDGVYEPAIQAVLDEPIAPENANRSRLWWADRMRYRAQEALHPREDQQKSTAVPIKSHTRKR
jgi:transcriptional regulator with XRE-family HTH domain